MLKKYWATLKACLGFTLVGLNTLFIFLFVFPIGWVKKFYINNKVVTSTCLSLLHKLGALWIINNSIVIKLLSGIKWQINGLEQLKTLPKDKWYLLISNHQSWNDVLVLQLLLNIKLPFQKYLVKEEIRKFPIMGFIWEAIDCPFLKRRNIKDQKQSDANDIAERMSDIDLIKQCCKKFKLAPATIGTFIEGTRYTDAKHHEQNSPYKYLLKPKPGGVAAVLEELHHEIKGIVDVSICYSPRKLSFFDLFAGNIDKITATINYIEIPTWLKDKYNNNISYEEYKTEFQDWINKLWLAKDNFMIECYNN